MSICYIKGDVGYPQFVGVAGGDSGRTLYSSLENVFTLLNHAILSISIYFGGDSWISVTNIRSSKNSEKRTLFSNTK